jgi:hypothetical protein
MDTNHKDEWEKMMEDTGWLRPKWATFYYSNAVYVFIWKSDESFGDEYISFLKRKIKRIIWELPLYFVSVIVLTFLFIYFKVL